MVLPLLVLNWRGKWSIIRAYFPIIPKKADSQKGLVAEIPRVSAEHRWLSPPIDEFDYELIHSGLSAERAIEETSLEIRKLYEGCPQDDLPILVYMGNPVTSMTWVGYKATGFPRAKVMGQAGNLDSRRICHAISQELGLSGNDMRGIVFGDHGDSMVVSPRYISLGGIPLDTHIESGRVDRKAIEDVIEGAKKGGTHFINETGQSASIGPAKAVGEMLRCIITGEPEIQPVVAIIEQEYDLLKKDDGLDSMGFGVPAKVGSYGVEKIYELPVEDIREMMGRSAELVKEDIRAASAMLKENFGLE
jgi:malate/lactate dehydrogenase